MKLTLLSLSAGAALCTALSVQAHEVREGSAADRPVLTLSSDVSEAVAPDQMRMTLAVEKVARDLSAANRQVLAQTQEALDAAKPHAAVEASLGQLTTQPVFDDKGRTSSWRVRAEVTLVSKNFGTLSQLGGQLAERMELQDVSFAISKDLKRDVQQRLLARLGVEFRSKAERASAALGFAHYEVQNVTLSEGGFELPVIAAYARPQMKSLALGAPLPAVPTAASKTDVSVSLSGTVRLLP